MHRRFAYRLAIFVNFFHQLFLTTKMDVNTSFNTTDDQTLMVLRSAENLFSEFHLRDISNIRKAEIEAQLKNLLDGPTKWKFWIDSIALTQNQYLIMYCLNLLNDLISNFWTSWTSVDQKNYIKDRLASYLTQKNTAFPSFIMVKIVKLVVDIGRNDWPHFYPNFFSNIEDLVDNPQLCLLGLKTLRLVCEEFIQPKEDIRQSRREEIKKLLFQKIPLIFGLLEKVLIPLIEILLKSDGNSSPTKQLVRNAVEAIQVSAVSVASDSVFEYSFAFFAAVSWCAIRLFFFQIFMNVLTWMPNGASVSASLLRALFYLGNCNPHSVDLYELGTNSLSGLSELVTKSCSTGEMEKNLWSVYEFAFVRLESLNQQISGKSGVRKLQCESVE